MLLIISLGLVAILAVVLYLKRKECRRLKAQFVTLYHKRSLEFDLELATTDQLLAEMRRRPQPQYVLLLPKFESEGISLNMEVHNLPPNIVSGLLTIAHKLSVKDQVAI